MQRDGDREVGYIIIKGEGERERRKDAQRQRETREGVGRHED